MIVNKITYISKYPVEYHHESLDYVCNKLKINYQEIFISDYSPIFGHQKVSESAHFLFKKYKKKPGFLSPFLSIRKIYAATKQSNLIIFHGYDNINIIFFILFFKFFKKNCLLSFRGESSLHSLSLQNRFKRKFLNFFKKKLFSLFDIVFYIGKNNFDYYKYFNLNKIFIHWPYTRILEANFQTSVTAIRNSKLQFIFVGKLEPIKGISIFIKNLNEFLEKENLKAKINIVGDGSEKNIIENMKGLFQKNLEIHLTGFLNREDVYSCYVRTDIFVLPSLHEPYGMVVPEACMHSLPLLLSSSIGAKDDYLDEGQNGFCFKNKAELFKSLKYFFESHKKNTLKKMGKISFEIYLNNNLDKTVTDLIKLNNLHV